MTDREERQHVIEVLKQMRLDYEDFWEENDTEEIKAFNYAIASIETDLKYDLLYEETSGQADKPTTKNDLVVDWESYKDVDGNSLDDLILEVLQNNFDCGNTYGYKVADEIIELLPSVTPQLSSGLEKNSKKLEKDFGESDCISRQATVKRLCNLAEFMNEHKEESGAPYIMAALFIQDNKTEFPSVTPQEPKSEWEHDHEILRAYADGANNVLDKLRAEIDKLYEREGSSFDRLNALDELKEFIDKYKAETENP